MKRFSRFLSFLMVGLLAFPATSLAATPSDAQRSPEIVKSLKDINIMDYALESAGDVIDQQSDGGIMPMSFVVDTSNISNTVPINLCSMGVWDRDSLHNFSKRLDSNGRAVISRSEAASLENLDRICINIPSGALPPPGTYEFQVFFGSDTGLEYRSSWIHARQRINNAVNPTDAKVFDLGNGFSQFSGDASFVCNITIGSNISTITLSFSLKNISLNNFPVGGAWKVNFKRTTDSPSFTTPGGPQTPEDTQQNISSGIDNLNGIASGISDKVGSVVQNSANMVSAQNQTNALIIQVIQHISDQLHAFWDQLAGEFTNLYAKMNDHHEELLDANRENTEDIMANDDKNRDHMENAYDNSQLNQDNDRLGSSINEYDQAESDVMDSVNDSLGAFSFDANFSAYLATIQSFSGFIQDMYDNAGALKDVINVSFMVSIASLVIGIYRFKEA